MSQSQKTYKLAPDLTICKIINGMWQVAGGHGIINSESAISEMLQYHDYGFTTWDMADIYGPAEEYLGEFRRRLSKKKGAQELDKEDYNMIQNITSRSRNLFESIGDCGDEYR